MEARSVGYMMIRSIPTPTPPVGRHSRFQGRHEFSSIMGFITQGSFPGLLLKPFPLDDGVIELGISIADLGAVYETLKSFGQLRIALDLGQGEISTG